MAITDISDNPEVQKAVDNLPQESVSGAVSKIERRRLSSAALEALATPPGRTIATGLLSLLTVAGLLFFAISPAISSISRQVEINAALTARNEQLENKRTILFGLIQKEKENTALIEKFDKLLGKDRYQPEIYTEVLAAVTSVGGGFEAINYDDSQDRNSPYTALSPNGYLRTQRVSLVVKVNSGQLLQLLKLIEKSQRLLIVENFTINPITKENPTELRATVNMTTFY